MRIAILHTTSTRISCALVLRMVATLKRLAPDVQIIVGVAPDTAAMAFYDTYQTDDFEHRGATIVTMTALEYKRVYRKKSHAEQVYRFTDEGSDFKDVDGIILSGAASGTFADLSPYMLVLPEPASAVQQLEPDVLIGYFETIQNASAVVFSNKRNQNHWKHYALAEGTANTSQNLEPLATELLIKEPFHRTGAPYIAYFTADRSSSLIEGDIPNASFIVNLPDEANTNTDFEKRWNLTDALQAAERIRLNPFQIGRFVEAADVVLIEHLEDMQDPRIRAANHFNKPLIMLLDDVTDAILENLDITLGLRSRVKGQEVGQIVLQAAKDFKTDSIATKQAEYQTDQLDRVVIGFLDSLRATSNEGVA